MCRCYCRNHLDIFFRKYSNAKFLENPSSGSPICSMLTYRQSHMTKLIVAFRNFANTSKKRIYCRTVTFTQCTQLTTQLHTTTANHRQHNQCRTPYAVVHGLVVLMMGIMMSETCCDRSWIINIGLVASCWFLSLHPTVYIFFLVSHIFPTEKQGQSSGNISVCKSVPRKKKLENLYCSQSNLLMNRYRSSSAKSKQLGRETDISIYGRF